MSSEISEEKMTVIRSVVISIVVITVIIGIYVAIKYLAGDSGTISFMKESYTFK